MDDHDDLSTLTVTRSKRPNESEEQFILFNILTVTARHLNLSEIGMWLIEERVLSQNDYEKFIKMRDSVGASTSDTVTELASMVYRNGTLSQFITALEHSSSDELGHETILEAIRKKQDHCSTNGIDTQEVEGGESNESMPHKRTTVAVLLQLLGTLKDPESHTKLSLAQTDVVSTNTIEFDDKMLPSLSTENKISHKLSKTGASDTIDEDSASINAEDHTSHETLRSEVLEPIPGQLRERRGKKTGNLPSPAFPNITIEEEADLATTPEPDQSLQDDIHKSVVDADNIMHITDPYLFQNMVPYKYFCRHRAWIEGVIAVFLVYQMLSSILITLCEEECVNQVFKDGHELDVMELVRRLCLFTMRVAVRVVIPFVFYRQLCRLAEGERHYLKILKARDAASHTRTSPLNKACAPRHAVAVTLWRSIVPHAVSFSAILLFIGAFLIAEDRLMEKSICIKKLFQIEIPFLGMQMCQFCDCLAVFFMLMVVGILKDCYCLENNSSAAKEYYDVMRKRWLLIDMFCYITPFFLLVFTVCMFAFGNPLVPDPPQDAGADDFIIWCFWIMALTLLQFCGSVAKKFLKMCCVIGHILCILLIFLITFVHRVEKIQIPPGSGVILLYTMLAVTLFNFLYCLMRCHLRVKGWKSSYFRFNVVCLVVLLLSLLATAIRESLHFAYFVIVL